MTNSLTIPGMPEWTGLLMLVLILLFAAAFLLMPFSVFGLKARLDALEVQLDEIQAEIRSLALRLTEPELPPRPPISEEWVEPPASYATREHAPPRITPPVPPPPAWPERRPVRGAAAAPPSRAEPRLDWPRNRS
ncbi:hypothetical protein [Roseomonas marmotae]|uniref:DUF2339 domain-containing protein n=1 Tax=Roseomonas marmotae TaxID=2768161 RepID=A0ABS3K9C2_9PROT|nr:hypothetical protein [Roseomonas marmotae]MBO1074040.1 hypothetical protein [Roseomonas marmotae]QTI78826.1 hypothetical protein IAI58_14385 [Roseomonas marmotae]